MTSPFGSYGPLVASVIGIALVLAAIASHLIPAFSTLDKDWIDNAALLVIGIMFGTRLGMNGAGQIALAAHKRLDAMGVPSSADGVK